MNAQRDRSEELAARLRGDPPKLDDVAQARMERRLLDALVTRSGTSARSWGRRSIALSFAGGLATAIVLFFVARTGGVNGPEATFEARDRAGVLQSGALREGDELATSQGEVMKLAVDDSELRLGGDARARVARLSKEELRIRLAQGSVEVAFHPRHRGEERLIIETPDARVEVVGTEFRVAISPEGRTSVSVKEGVVRVVPVDGSDVELVRAGGVWDAAASALDVTVAARAGEAVAPSVRVPSPEVLAVPPSTRVPSQSPEARAEEAPVVEPEASRALAESATEAEPTEAEQVPSAENPETLGVEGAVPVRAVELEDDPRFDLAEIHRRRGEFGEARAQLYAILRNNRSRPARARAWTMIAETYARSGDDMPAAEAYRRAADEGRRTTPGANALFALAMLRERLGQRPAAVSAYARYLEDFPSGSHRDLCRQALCRLGESWYCPSTVR